MEINLDWFLSLNRQWANCTLNAAYHDFGYTEQQVEELDRLWEKHNAE